MFKNNYYRGVIIAVLFLLIIYGVFINLGLPDSLLGVAWPAMQVSFGVDFSFAGFTSMIISFGTVVSSLFSARMIKLLGTGKIVFISVFMTASALFGFFLSQSFVYILLMAIPLGLGAGSIDAALNGYVAKHYSARHMNWLHCFWGVGALISPIIMSFFITNGPSWRMGYLTVSIIQFVFVIILFFSLPFWSKINNESSIKDELQEIKDIKSNNIFYNLNLKGVKTALMTFFLYCGIEATMGLWGSSFLVKVKGISIGEAALLVSAFYTFITIGRFISGVLSKKLSNKSLVRIGQFFIFLGILLLFIPFYFVSRFGFLILGFGCAPIFPSLLHETPIRFGNQNAQAIMGLQMAFAYIGTTFLPPMFGFLTSKISIYFFPIFLLSYAVIMILCNERTNRVTSAY